MNKFNYIVLICAALLLGSCAERVGEADLITISGYDNPPKNNCDGIEVKDFKIIPLETSKESLVVGALEYIIHDSYLIIKSQTGLKCFDLDGNYLHSFGTKGKGHGEYIAIDSFYIDDEAHNINIIDKYKKVILTYSLDGRYLSTQKMSSENSHDTYRSYMVDDKTLIMANYITAKANTIYTFFDLSSMNHTDIYSFPVNSDNSFERIGNAPISILRDDIKVIIPFDNKIYKIENGTLAPIYRINTKLSTIRMSEIREIRDFSIMSYVNYMDKNRFVGFTDILESDSHILLGFMNLNYFLVNKESCIGVLYNYKIDVESNCLPLINIASTHKDYFIGSCSAMQLKEIVDNISNKSQYYDYIAEKSQSISENNNPIILLYKLSNQ